MCLPGVSLHVWFNICVASALCVFLCAYLCLSMSLSVCLCIFLYVDVSLWIFFGAFFFVFHFPLRIFVPLCYPLSIVSVFPSGCVVYLSMVVSFPDFMCLCLWVCISVCVYCLSLCISTCSLLSVFIYLFLSMGTALCVSHSLYFICLTQLIEKRNKLSQRKLMFFPALYLKQKRKNKRQNQILGI